MFWVETHLVTQWDIEEEKEISTLETITENEGVQRNFFKPVQNTRLKPYGKAFVDKSRQDQQVLSYILHQLHLHHKHTVCLTTALFIALSSF